MLNRRTDFVITNLLAAKQSNDSLKRRTHGRFSAFVFERDEKQRRFRKADGTLFRWIGKFRGTKRNFDCFLRCLIIRAEIFRDALAPARFAFTRLVDYDRRVFGKPFAEA